LTTTGINTQALTLCTVPALADTATMQGDPKLSLMGVGSRARGLPIETDLAGVSYLIDNGLSAVSLTKPPLLQTMFAGGIWTEDQDSLKPMVRTLYSDDDYWRWMIRVRNPKQLSSGVVKAYPAAYVTNTAGNRAKIRFRSVGTGDTWQYDFTADYTGLIHGSMGTTGDLDVSSFAANAIIEIDTQASGDGGLLVHTVALFG
jgi:hypothetical protein